MIVSIRPMHTARPAASHQITPRLAAAVLVRQSMGRGEGSNLASRPDLIESDEELDEFIAFSHYSRHTGLALASIVSGGSRSASVLVTMLECRMQLLP